MAEYIEREAVLKWFEPYLGVGETWVEIHPVLDAIHTSPAADVAPVVHGRWILIAENSTGLIYYCSSCEKYINPNENDVAHGRAKEKPDYCPNCGARMDGE